MLQSAQVFHCGQGHSYDIAKEGYVNLLLANQKASSAPGDTKEMAVARRCFLSGAHYAELSDRINALASNKSQSVLDAGCGEGYYLGRLQATLPFLREAYGLDISKESIKLGAMRYKQCRFLVASLHQELPFPDASFDIILNVFAPRNPVEFARVLQPNGQVVVVIPAEGHLAALHDALGLAQIDGDKQRRTVSDFAGALHVRRTETLRYQRVLSSEDVFHLIQMTPTFWQLSDQARVAAKKIPSLDIEFAFTLMEFEKDALGAAENE